PCADKDKECSSEGKCVPKEDDTGKCGEGCTGDTYCLKGKCQTVKDIEKEDCSSNKDINVCTNNAILSCQQWETGASVYHIEKCKSGQLCIPTDTDSLCVDPCKKEEAEKGKIKKGCDPYLYDTGEGISYGEITYKCVEKNGAYYYVVDSKKTCSGNETCDEYTPCPSADGYCCW
ncbi:MAG: hypothetical protein IJM59_10370, partial [Proteobacteria bacterium]|nr:hypothetical protein [Pseudomonadota bacterium]